MSHLLYGKPFEAVFRPQKFTDHLIYRTMKNSILPYAANRPFAQVCGLSVRV